MRKILPQVAIVVAIALVGYRYYTITQPETVMMLPPQTKADILSKTIFADTTTGSTSGDVVTESGMYADYTQPTVQQSLDDGKRVVLFFYAARDPTCRQIDEDIKMSLNKLPSDVAVFKVDYDAQTELKQKYDVKTQYTLVMIDKDRNKVNLAVGPSFQALLNFIK